MQTKIIAIDIAKVRSTNNRLHITMKTKHRLFTNQLSLRQLELFRTEFKRHNNNNGILELFNISKISTSKKIQDLFSAYIIAYKNSVAYDNRTKFRLVC